MKPCEYVGVTAPPLRLRSRPSDDRSMILVMNEPLFHCTESRSTCRLLQLEDSGPRPVWAVLDGAIARRFTGEVTIHLDPMVRAYFQDGHVYFAERDGDAPLAERLLQLGVVTEDDLRKGMISLGVIAHLGRLFDRVPTVERDQVELALEVMTGQLLGVIGNHTITDTTVATYRHHSSGVNRWLRTSAVLPSVARVLGDRPVGRVPSSGANDTVEMAALDRSIIADYEAATAADALAATFGTAPVEEPASVKRAQDHVVVSVARPESRFGTDLPTMQVATTDDEWLTITESPTYYRQDEPPAELAPPAQRGNSPLPAPSVVPMPAPAQVVVATPEPAPAPLLAPAPAPVHVRVDPATAAPEGPSRVMLRPTIFEPVRAPEPTPGPPLEAPAAHPMSALSTAAAPTIDPDSDPTADRIFGVAPVEFDLARVIEAVARESGAMSIPVTDDDDIDESVRIAVREALAEITAATRPRVVDTLSPIAFERALESATGTDPGRNGTILSPERLDPRTDLPVWLSGPPSVTVPVISVTVPTSD